MSLKIKLLAKFLVLTLLFCDGRLFEYGEIYTSVFPFIESFYIKLNIDSYLFEDFSFDLWIWRIFYFLLSTFVLFEYRIRASCIGLGILLIYALGVNQVLYNNNTFYIASFFIVIGASPKTETWNLLYKQVALMYILTVLSKGDGWYNGDFLKALFQDHLFFSKYLDAQLIEEGIPPILLTGLSIFTLLLELSIAIFILFKNTRIYSAAIAILIHLTLCFFMGRMFSTFIAIIIGFNFNIFTNLQLKVI